VPTSLGEEDRIVEARERELKLELDAAAARDLRERRLKRLGAEAGGHQALAATYFDTKKLALKKRGLSLRLREEDGRRIQTLKGPNEGGGLFDRLEWSIEVSGDRPDLSGLPGTPLRDLVSAERLQSRLRPIFTTEIERTTWRVRSETAEIEMALDEGTLRAGDSTEPLAELELELKAGSPADLFKLARALGPAGAFRLGVRTKAERGYALAAGAAPVAVKAEPLTLPPSMTAADAFRAIVGGCVRHFRLNEPLVTEARSAEALHQARVALRRLRSALSLFKDIVADEEVDKLKAGLRRIWQRLGEARDLDVVLADLEGERDAADPGRAELIERLGRDRDAAYDRVVATLGEGRFRRLVLDLVAWSEAGPWREEPQRQALREEPLETFAAEVLARRRRKIRKRGRDLTGLDVDAQHRVRIEAKKLRYATEFFASLAATKKARERHRVFLKSLESLQEHLGRANDLATGERVASRLPEEERASLAGLPAVPDPARARNAALTAATAAFGEFARAKRFWRAV
jgi:triphosphatase